ncbi:Peroxisomal membrane protein PEX17 [Neolecta irregularis DAH-3]|uniref:Peroxisomal membrane protein PEX17 n=1 Tax=Neolecta irregularis (strain DAH-3) TaxID=1198029 RepID=A0A1U7LUQ7_NEOID|nr:Peroxisomal membrane protein PEX17 [Neolecta irregularis DAH-3]|eukprot:OLL26313.1 Peroxisomal membrane protein PEX17 [Neolecta irregularis DAH-3]
MATSAQPYLDSLLQTLKSPIPDADSKSIASAAASLLPNILNSRNVTLLTRALIQSPALWKQSQLTNAILIYHCFFTAAQGKVEMGFPYLNRKGWCDAILEALEHEEPAWKKIPILCGLMSGFCSTKRQFLSSNLRTMYLNTTRPVIQKVRKMNSLEDLDAVVWLWTWSRISRNAPKYTTRIVASQNTVFLAVQVFLQNSNSFIEALYSSNADIGIENDRFCWKDSSTSYNSLHNYLKHPLHSHASSIARFLSEMLDASELIVDKGLLMISDELMKLSQKLLEAWKAVPFSNLEQSAEADSIEQQTLSTTLPTLWQAIKDLYFVAITLLQAVSTQMIHSRQISESTRIIVATKNLNILRNFSFVSYRLGHSAFANYRFIWSSAIDILASDKIASLGYLKSVLIEEVCTEATPLLERLASQWFLDSSEELAPLTCVRFVETYVLPFVIPFLESKPNKTMKPLYESAHSAMLAIVGSNELKSLSIKLLPRYTAVVLEQFPSYLSFRQFKLAISTLFRISAPQSPLSFLDPLLSDQILSLLHTKIKIASHSKTVDESGTTEYTACILTLVECLPSISVCLLQHTLEKIATYGNNVAQRRELADRVWSVITNDIDMERAAIAVKWWCSQNGREKMLGSTGEKNSAEERAKL